ncbi:MAG: hypothetical protein ACO2OR_07705 [Desulfurococcaceae archaeon]
MRSEEQTLVARGFFTNHYSEDSLPTGLHRVYCSITSKCLKYLQLFYYAEKYS